MVRTGMQKSLWICATHRSNLQPRRHRQLTHRQAWLSTRPAFAPRPALDIKHIRQNPGLYEQNCKDRNHAARSSAPWRIIELHEQWLHLQEDARILRERKNALHVKLKRAGSAGGAGTDAEHVALAARRAIQEAKVIKDELGALESKEVLLLDEIDELAQDLPNLSSVHSPPGTEPHVVGYINLESHAEAAPGGPSTRSHVEIGMELGILDFAGATQTSGWGWYFLVGDGAMLELALVQYALDVARKRGWRAVSPPSLVYAHIATACGFRPRDQGGEQQIYAVEQAEKDEAKPQMVLAGTAEIPLAGMKANHIFQEEDLPLKVVGTSRSYRAEAGARGVDTKGLYRVHEFTKVEMFAWTVPETNEKDHFAADADAAFFGASMARDIFAEMQSIQVEILQSLGLPCRIVEMPTTDLGASASRKRDIEAFFPSRQSKNHGWGEVTSTSMCTDYQTRRLHTRLKRSKAANKLEFPHTLNGTALAVPRVLAAILENGWDEDTASVAIPAALQPWMGGLVRMTKT